VQLALNNNYPEAQQVHYQLIELINYLFIEGNPSGVKAALTHMGIIKNKLRLPLVPVSAETNSKISECIKKIQQ